MKTINQNGFVLTMIIIFVALLILCGGIFVYKNKTVEAPVVINPNLPTKVSTSTVTNTKIIINRYPSEVVDLADLIEVISTSTPKIECKNDTDCKELSCPGTFGFAHEICTAGKCILPAGTLEKCMAQPLCNCPAGYVLEKDVCTPKCYYSTPKCLAPSIMCSAAVTNTAKINKKVIVNGLSIAPLKVTEDSRCPVGVQCIWAGTVRLDAQIDNATTSLRLDTSTIINGKEITLIKVLPEKTATAISQSDYSFEFSVK